MKTYFDLGFKRNKDKIYRLYIIISYATTCIRNKDSCCVWNESNLSWNMRYFVSFYLLI